MKDTAHFLPAAMSDRTVTERVIDLPLRFPARRSWWICMALSSLLLTLFVVSATVLLVRGVGVWGNDIPVAWAFDILNYMWWLGIGHAGTFISALLLLLERPWRNSLNRVAELMTLMAVCCAGLYPLLHLGRPGYFFWTAPYPSTTGLWPQFRSPTAWDFFAVLTYLLVSIAFLYLGALPDFAALRDRARSRLAQIAYGLLALGWRFDAAHFQHWHSAYRFIALLAVPLVFAVSSGYSFLLDLGTLPGWHSTVFPPYFVAGAVFSGFAMVALLACALRRMPGWDELINVGHLDMLGRLLLASGWLTAYGYVADIFMAFYSSDPNERIVTLARLSGPTAWSFWMAVICNVGILQALWWPTIRRSPKALCCIAVAVLVGMWCERFMLLVTPQTRDFMPSAWSDAYSPSFWEISLFIGSFGVFGVPFCLFVRLLPMISAVEVKQALHQARRQA